MVTPDPEPCYNPCGGDLCLDFVNSIGRSPGKLEGERLGSYELLLEWCVQAENLPRPQAVSLSKLSETSVAAAREVLERAIAFREATFRCCQGLIHRTSPDPRDVERINGEVAQALAHAQLEPGDRGYHWTWSAPGDLSAPLRPIVRATANLLTSADRCLIRECASEKCLWLFVDRTRNRCRRWCEMKGCGNREKVRRHRKRRGKDRSD